MRPNERRRVPRDALLARDPRELFFSSRNAPERRRVDSRVSRRIVLIRVSYRSLHFCIARRATARSARSACARWRTARTHGRVREAMTTIGSASIRGGGDARRGVYATLRGPK